MAARLNKTDRKKYDRLMSMYLKAEEKGDSDRSFRLSDRLMDFAAEMDEKYGEVLEEIGGFAKGGLSKKKTKKSKMNKGGMVDHRKKGLFK
tara:strand:- start:168 stop:440 length:273 start_codon:yes stop_codon:yes gene_type:complete